MGGIYSCFRANGFENPQLEGLIRHLATTRSAKSTEYPLWRRIDLHYGFNKLGMAAPVQELFRDSWLASLPEPWLITNDSAYATTHEVFYLTDFGADPEALSVEVRNYLRLWLPAWINIFLGEDNWDISAELIMVSCCIGGVAWSDNPLSRLIAAQLPDGSFPSPPGGGASLLSREDSADRRTFLHVYHTTLVALMALALSYRCGRSPAPTTELS